MKRKSNILIEYIEEYYDGKASWKDHWDWIEGKTSILIRKSVDIEYKEKRRWRIIVGEYMEEYSVDEGKGYYFDKWMDGNQAEMQELAVRYAWEKGLLDMLGRRNSDRN